MIDPKKLLAFIAKETQSKPFDNPEMYDGGIEEEGNPDEGVGEEEEEEEEEEGEEISEEEIEEIAEMIEDGEGDPELMELADELAEEIEEMGDDAENPPKWAANPAIWKRAEKAVDPEGKGSKYSEPYAVVAHVYKKMQGGIK